MDGQQSATGVKDGVSLGSLADLPGVSGCHGARDVRVSGVESDSRAVAPGMLFVALPGARDGRDFVAEALARGAVAVACASPLPSIAAGMPWLELSAPRRAIGPIAEAVYGSPSHALRLFGVTGTNGKTTTVWAYAALARALGDACATWSTIDHHVPGEAPQASSFTTPEAPAMSRFAAKAVAAGAQHLAMEVSSHGLAQHRVDGLRFAVAGFTGLGRDHLDYHETVEGYFAAKARLFSELAPAARVVCVDTEHGQLLAEAHPDALTVSTDPASPAALTFYRMPGSGRATLSALGNTLVVEGAPLGRYNLANWGVAIGAHLSLGTPWSELASAVVSACAGTQGPSLPPGRLQRVSDDSAAPNVERPAVFVDYAHTPDALAAALAAVRESTRGRVWALFGCGGDRDRGKRPQMGAIAAELADVVVLTSDNPRSEDPDAILSEIQAGIPGAPVAPGRLHREVDRAAAIAWAIEHAHPQDAILIAGKGHETSQIIGQTRLPFSDYDVALAALRR